MHRSRLLALVVGAGALLMSTATAQAAPSVSNVVFSTAYSGYGVSGPVGNRPAFVGGVFTVPTLKCPASGTTRASSWTGLLTTNTSNLVQTGIGLTCASGKPSYYAWWEVTPGDQVPLANSSTAAPSSSNFPVRPGDQISAYTMWNPTAPNYSVQLTNQRTGQSWYKPLYQSNKPLQAECIVEAPTVNGAVAPLADFGTINFSYCAAARSPQATAGSYQYGPFGDLARPLSSPQSVKTMFGWTPFKEVDVSSTVTRTAVSSWTTDGHITVTWEHS